MIGQADTSSHHTGDAINILAKAIFVKEGSHALIETQEITSATSHICPLSRAGLLTPPWHRRRMKKPALDDLRLSLLLPPMSLSSIVDRFLLPHRG